MRFICTAVEQRRPVVEYLQRHIPDLLVVWDEGEGPKPTNVRALRAAGDDAAVILEDDLVLCRNFPAEALSVAGRHPDDVVSLFTRKLPVRARYIDSWGFMGSQAMMFPAGAAAAIAEFFPRAAVNFIDPQGGRDQVYGEWAKKHDVRFWLEEPNLVDQLPLASAIRPSTTRYHHSRSFPFEEAELDGFPDVLAGPLARLQAFWAKRGENR